jgi:hypothetical protein
MLSSQAKIDPDSESIHGRHPKTRTQEMNLRFVLTAVLGSLVEEQTHSLRDVSLTAHH